MHSTVLKQKGEANLSQYIRHNMDNIEKCIKDPGDPVVKTARIFLQGTQVLSLVGN